LQLPHLHQQYKNFKENGNKFSEILKEKKSLKFPQQLSVKVFLDQQLFFNMYKFFLNAYFQLRE